MNQYPKRLIEVDLPIKRISAHARREKSIRHGHISTLHIWWARRPLAACRAVICAALWIDPVDELCPQEFREKAAELITAFAKKAVRDEELAAHCSTESWSRWQVLAKPENKLDLTKPNHLNLLRNALLDFIADFANWDNSTQTDYLETSRSLTQAAHESLGGIPGTKPLVVDPFAGGGAIPLESLRVGADAFASDVNPVAVLLNKVVLEYIPKYGQRLADEVRKWGQWVKSEAEKELAEFYPKDRDGAIPIAYLWARTIVCEGPGCGVQIPMMRSPWLAKKGNRSFALKLVPNIEEKQINIELLKNPKAKEVGNGTVKRGSVTCPCCGYTTAVASVRRQLKEQQGGAKNARFLAVVTTRKNERGRFYRLPTEIDISAILKAEKVLEKRNQEYQNEISLIPDEILPLMSGVFNAPIYGHTTWGSLFTPRQLLLLTTLSRLVREVIQDITAEELPGLSTAVATILACAVDREAEHSTSLCRWNAVGEKMQATFGRQAIPMLWDYCEANPFGGSVGSWETMIDCVLIPFETATCLDKQGHIEIASATLHPLPDDAAQAFITDPPYYNAVPYADLSDFFYVWLRRTLTNQYPDLLSDALTPKEEEICEMAGWDPIRYPHKNGRWFEEKMGQAMLEGRRFLAPNGIGIVVFAHKSTSGWETLLQAMIEAGLTVTGSWSIDTEMSTRLRAMNSATLASSVHLVCRPRENCDGSLQESIGDWRDVLQELPQRIHEWMPRLSAEGVVGADAIFACLGPALEIFSRYSRVEKASGEQVTLKEYLEYVWAAVSKEALGMIFENADTAGFEEDARLTAMWLWTLSTGSVSKDEIDVDEETVEVADDDEDSGKTAKTGGYVLEFDAARKIAQGLGAHLEKLETLVQVKGEKAYLLSVAERSGYLFGKEEVKTPKKGKKSNTRQLSLLSSAGTTEDGNEDWGDPTVTKAGNTVLDRIHQTMILFAAGRSEALKSFLVDQGVGSDQRFWTLAQALSALYPTGSDEKRWVDGVLARKKGLGF